MKRVEGVSNLRAWYECSGESSLSAAVAYINLICLGYTFATSSQNALENSSYETS